MAAVLCIMGNVTSLENYQLDSVNVKLSFEIPSTILSIDNESSLKFLINSTVVDEHIICYLLNLKETLLGPYIRDIPPSYTCCTFPISFRRLELLNHMLHGK